MSDAERLTPASPEDIADALAFALLFEGRRRIHHADELVTRMVARPLVKRLERAGFVVMKKPPARRSLRARARIWVSPIALRENIQNRDHQHYDKPDRDDRTARFENNSTATRASTGGFRYHAAARSARSHPAHTGQLIAPFRSAIAERETESNFSPGARKSFGIERRPP
jgi:hypothetical protein